MTKRVIKFLATKINTEIIMRAVTAKLRALPVYLKIYATIVLVDIILWMDRAFLALPHVLLVLNLNVPAVLMDIL